MWFINWQDKLVLKENIILFDGQIWRNLNFLVKNAFKESKRGTLITDQVKDHLQNDIMTLELKVETI